jgi:hypothetical protein
MKEELKKLAVEISEWAAFDPKPDPFAATSAIDLRLLNERVAGENGFITVRDGSFTYEKTGKPVRFWAVNGPPQAFRKLRDCARMLAKHGVNLVRVHGGYFDERASGSRQVRHALEIVEAMAEHLLLLHLFPLWIRPQPETHG